jgi:hypothetical protein
MGLSRWPTVLALIVGGAVWLELFLRYPLYSVVLLAAIGGWWDYMRRRSKLKPR